VTANKQLAAALAGDRAALGELAFREDARAAIVGGRIAPALALRAGELGVGGPEVDVWRRELFAATSHGLLLRSALEKIGAILAAAGVAWAPFKGLGLSPHVYPQWEERPTGDIDLLVAGEVFEHARRTLEAVGWRSMADVTGADEFVEAEGYNWQAVGEGGVLLELHFRLWGCAPEGLAAAIFDRAQPDLEMGPTARCLQLSDAYVIGAVHWWTTPPPRLLIHLWDLRRIAAAAKPDLAERVVAEVRRWGLQLLVAPVAEAAAGLWGDDTNRTVAVGARAGLRPAERLAARRIRRTGADAVGLEVVSLARLLSGRESRMGWKAAWRRVWPHPAVLREKTPEGWSWPHRRVRFAAERLGLLRRAR
jgi:hypothetical protein